MFALRQGRKSWIRLIWGETLLNICNEKTKILERTWSEDGAALVRTWCGLGMMSKKAHIKSTIHQKMSFTNI